MGYEQARLADQLGVTHFTVDAVKKIKPVTVLSGGEPSNNLLFAVNTLVLHHGYDSEKLTQLWRRQGSI